MERPWVCLRESPLHGNHETEKEISSDTLYIIVIEEKMLNNTFQFLINLGEISNQ